jgi:hypothetical protein
MIDTPWELYKLSTSFVVLGGVYFVAVEENFSNCFFELRNIRQNCEPITGLAIVNALVGPERNC